MLLIPWHKDRVSGTDTDPRSGLVHFTFAGVEKNLVFPGVRMTRSVSTRRKIKTTHAEIVRPVTLADDHPSRDSFGNLGIKMNRLHGLCGNNFHFITFRCRRKPDQ